MPRDRPAWWLASGGADPAAPGASGGPGRASTLSYTHARRCLEQRRQEGFVWSHCQEGQRLCLRDGRTGGRRPDLDTPLPTQQTALPVLGVFPPALLLPHAQARPMLREDVEPCIHPRGNSRSTSYRCTQSSSVTFIVVYPFGGHDRSCRSALGRTRSGKRRRGPPAAAAKKTAGPAACHA